MTRDHAFAMVQISGENIDVETTNRFGFDPGNRREFHNEAGRLTGFTYVPAQNYRDRQTITPIELVSLILSNRISELERRSRFSESVPLAIDRTALLTGFEPGAAVRTETPASFFENPSQDLMNRLLNYAAFLLNSGREEDCLRWVAYTASRYPDENRWQEIIMAAVNNRIARLIRSGNFTDARNFFEAQASALNQVNYAQLNLMLTDMEQRRRVTDFHNRFATEWNRRNFDEARRILDEGLAEFPNDRQLLRNRETVNRHRP
jgi:hypothetical protein